MKLLPYTIKVVDAYSKGLNQIKILKKGELDKIFSVLKKVNKDFKKNRIKNPDSAKTLTGYFKNLKKIDEKLKIAYNEKDQLLTTTRLYMRDTGKEIVKEINKLGKGFLFFAQNYRNFPLPGGGGDKKNEISSFAHIGLSFAEELFDDLQILKTILKHIDKNPLGSVNGYGSDLLLPREFLTKELKFQEIQINSYYCLKTAGKFENLFLDCLFQTILTLDRFFLEIIELSQKKKDFLRILSKKHDLNEMIKIKNHLQTFYKNQQNLKKFAKESRDGKKLNFKTLEKLLTENVEITLQSLKAARIFLKHLKPNTASINKLNPQFYNQNRLSKVLSLGSVGNLDLNHYKRSYFRER
ncbi:hypothetical protein HY604_02785 [Candidatus Peregrinibacteria bacterium]|nr:hypothetical protein [Candidatus Peregrinibacteria bacterium]